MGVANRRRVDNEGSRCKMLVGTWYVVRCYVDKRCSDDAVCWLAKKKVFTNLGLPESRTNTSEFESESVRSSL